MAYKLTVGAAPAILAPLDEATAEPLPLLRIYFDQCRSRSGLRDFGGPANMVGTESRLS